MDREQDFGAKPDTKASPAIGYSVACNMGGDRQMTVQCFVGEDEADDVVNAKMDRVFRVVDRQKARYDLDKHYKEFEEAGRHLRNLLNAIPVAEKNDKFTVAALTVELAAKEAARKEVFEEGYNAHAAGHRRGAFAPGGALKGRLAAMDSEIQKVKDKIAAVPAEQEAHRSTTMVNIQRYRDDLHQRRLVINDLRTQVGLGPYTEFMDEETSNPLEAGKA